MEHFDKLFLLALTLSAGVGLRYKLEPDSEPVKVIIFAITIMPRITRITDATKVKAAE